MRNITQRVGKWADANFDGRDQKHRSLLGALEELGELAHSHLKAEQGIRVHEDLEAKRADAIADTVIYLADYCYVHDLDLEEIVEATLVRVLKRDWREDPETGGRECSRPERDPSEPQETSPL